MRILWITRDTLDQFYPYAKGRPSKSASWTSPLFYSLHNNKALQLGSVATVVDGCFQKESIKDIMYYSVPIKSGDNMRRLPKDQIQIYKEIIVDFKPDIIHIYGVEYNFGLLRKYVHPNIPIVCSIQGLVFPCYMFIKHSVSSINLNKYRSLKNRLGRGGLSSAFRRWENYMDIEKEIIEINKYFIGRTMWDKSQLAAYNANAKYFHGEELLRSVFYTKEWCLKKCQPYRIFISSSAYPLKGFHILLKAVSILKNKYPNIQIVAPLSSLNLNSSVVRDFIIAEDYDNYLKKEIQNLGLEKHLILLKRLNENEMSDEFCKAHVFVLPSFVENSPNALAEAMSIGTPSVVSPVGGVMSMVKDEESGLFFPSGDYNMLAYQIGRLFENDDLALRLSKNGKSIASIRHNIDDTTDNYISIYKEIIKTHLLTLE